MENLPVATGGALVESHRAVAEAIAARKVALANPRDARKAEDLIIRDCASVELAEEASYEYGRGGTDISGASIRLLEVIARRWGNLECGVKELARGNGYSDVLAYAIDLESGFTDKKEFQVRHWRDTKKGGYVIKEERDIYEVVANQGARRKRACLEAIIPTDIKDKALKACEDTLKTKVQITPDFINKVIETFGKYGVTQQMIEKRIQRSMPAMTPGHAVQLRRIVTSLKDNMSQPSDWFEMSALPEENVDAGGQPPKSNPNAGATRADALADELGGRKSSAAPPPKTEEGERKEQRPAAEQQPAPARDGAAAAAALEETGEITHASVRKAIAAAGSPERLQTILLGDIMKLAPGPERDETMKAWGDRTKELKGEKPAEPTPAPKPAAKAPAPGKPHGTAKIKAELLARMNAAKTHEALDEAANEITLYGWDQKDKDEMASRYQQCREDLDL